MSPVTRNLRPFAVWLLLMAATLLSCVAWMGTGWVGSRVAGSAVIIISLAKAWLIGMQYMELKEAAYLLRRIYVGWLLFVGAILLVMFWWV